MRISPLQHSDDYGLKGLTTAFTRLLKAINDLIARTGGTDQKASGALPSYTAATVPDATLYEACLIFVSNEAGGAVPAFSDGTNWRRVTDRAIVS